MLRAQFMTRAVRGNHQQREALAASSSSRPWISAFLRHVHAARRFVHHQNRSLARQPFGHRESSAGLPPLKPLMFPSMVGVFTRSFST
jgi:hypothetical protein